MDRGVIAFLSNDNRLSVAYVKNQNELSDTPHLVSRVLSNNDEEIERECRDGAKDGSFGSLFNTVTKFEDLLGIKKPSVREMFMYWLTRSHEWVQVFGYTNSVTGYNELLTEFPVDIQQYVLMEEAYVKAPALLYTTGETMRITGMFYPDAVKMLEYIAMESDNEIGFVNLFTQPVDDSEDWMLHHIALRGQYGVSLESKLFMHSVRLLSDYKYALEARQQVEDWINYNA